MIRPPTNEPHGCKTDRPHSQNRLWVWGSWWCSVSKHGRILQISTISSSICAPYLLTQRTTDKYTHRLSTIWSRQGQTIWQQQFPMPGSGACADLAGPSWCRLVWWCAGIFLLPSICHIFSFWFPLLWLRYILLIAFDAFIEFQIDLSQRGSVATVVQLWLPKSIFRTLQTSFFDQSGRQ